MGVKLIDYMLRWFLSRYLPNQHVPSVVYWLCPSAPKGSRILGNRRAHDGTVLRPQILSRNRNLRQRKAGTRKRKKNSNLFIIHLTKKKKAQFNAVMIARIIWQLWENTFSLLGNTPKSLNAELLLVQISSSPKSQARRFKFVQRSVK